MSKWTVVMTHKGYDIKVITLAMPSEIGYYVGNKKFYLIQEAVNYIDKKFI